MVGWWCVYANVGGRYFNVTYSFPYNKVHVPVDALDSYSWVYSALSTIHSVGDDKNRFILARHVPQQMYIHSLVMDTCQDMLTISVVANRYKCPSIPILVVSAIAWWPGFARVSWWLWWSWFVKYGGCVWKSCWWEITEMLRIMIIICSGVHIITRLLLHVR